MTASTVASGSDRSSRSAHRNSAAGTKARASPICSGEMSIPMTECRSANALVVGIPAPQPRSTTEDDGASRDSSSAVNRALGSSRISAAQAR